MDSQRDTLFATPRAAVRPFAFDREVVDVFDDMIQRSVPLYRNLLEQSAQWIVETAQPGTAVVDLGCSTGALFAHAMPRLTDTAIAWHGVDASAPMVDRARAALADVPGDVHWHISAVEDWNWPTQKASVVVANYTLQFIDPARRLGILRQIRQALVPGGMLILSEKLIGETPQQTEFQIAHYHAYKRRVGYSELEIRQKDEALEGVLRPWKESHWQDALARAGFESPWVAFRWLAFTTFVCVV
jgi:tRNA (cmo5U34)-methyltransferase